MKKLIFIVLAVILTVVFAGCSAKQSAPAATEAPAPAATAAPAAPAATAAPAQEATAAAAQQNNTKIDMEAAKSTALKDAGLEASQVQFTKEKLDTDDGVEKYEIEFNYNGYEYEYDIDAKNGTIIEKSKDLIND